MSTTKGIVAFKLKDGTYRVAYNDDNAMPEKLGANVVKEIQAAHANGRLRNWWENLAKNLVVLKGDAIPTTAQIEECKATIVDLRKNGPHALSWYELLYGAEGSAERVLNAGYINNFVNEKTGLPIHQDYSYIINFQTNKFEFYANPYSPFDKEYTTESKLLSTHEFYDLPDWSGVKTMRFQDFISSFK